MSMTSGLQRDIETTLHVIENWVSENARAYARAGDLDNPKFLATLFYLQKQVNALLDKLRGSQKWGSSVQSLEARYLAKQGRQPSVKIRSDKVVPLKKMTEFLQKNGWQPEVHLGEFIKGIGTRQKVWRWFWSWPASDPWGSEAEFEQIGPRRQRELFNQFHVQTYPDLVMALEKEGQAKQSEAIQVAHQALKMLGADYKPSHATPNSIVIEPSHGHESDRNILLFIDVFYGGLIEQIGPRLASQTADQAYTERWDKVQKLYKDIGSHLTRHKAEQHRDPMNWGYVGDLGKVLEDLGEIAEFLG